MSVWSAENATNAYLRAIKMGKRAKEPEAAEFISALAAGTNARLIVVVCADAADRTTLVALVSAAHQTRGQVVCILRGSKELQLSKENLDEIGVEDHIKFVIGNAENLLESEFREADCIVVDCRIKNSERVLKTGRGVGKNVMVLGYNAFMIGRQFEFDAYLLPIGNGILVSRGDESDKKNERRFGSGKRSRWVVKVDKVTGEEHVFRVRANSQGNKVI
ncbi:hypothetical protein CASFOL_008406 [Castilleja foliolosa]|uniref:Uncharacterized protein n=1 Tax=Castilleja foliolosa TaxID=1961234 RepID=A0ABD3DYW7_9LAMI